MFSVCLLCHFTLSAHISPVNNDVAFVCPCVVPGGAGVLLIRRKRSRTQQQQHPPSPRGLLLNRLQSSHSSRAHCVCVSSVYPPLSPSISSSITHTVFSVLSCSYSLSMSLSLSLPLSLSLSPLYCVYIPSASRAKGPNPI